MSPPCGPEPLGRACLPAWRTPERRSTEHGGWARVRAACGGRGRMQTRHPVTWRVIQWATGGVRTRRHRGLSSTIPSSSSSAAGCTARTRTGATSASSSGVPARRRHGDHRRRRAARLDADCVLYSPILADPDGRRPDPALGQERGHAARLVLPRHPPRRRAARGGVPGGPDHAARHGHPPRRHHRALPAHGVGAVAGASRTSAPRSSPTSAPTARPT